MAALLLTGCGKDDTPDMPSFIFPQNGSSAQGTPGSTSSVKDTGVPSFEQSDTSETGEPSSAVGEIRTLVLSNDPINEKIIEINGRTMTVTGRTADSRIKRLSLSRECADVDVRLTSDGFIANIELTDLSYDSLRITFIYEDDNSNSVYFETSGNGFKPYDLSDIIADNRSAVENALEQPGNQVAEYIVEGGDPEKMREVMDEVQKLSDEICGGINNDYDKLRAISRWVSANIYYDYPAYDLGVPAVTLSLRYLLDNHSGVCGGYSNMTSALCAAQGIKCWNVHGSVLTDDNSFALYDDGVYHEWNFAEIDGRIIWLDAGWDSYCKLRRDGTYFDDGIGYRYFDIGEEYFAANHRANYAEYRDYFALLQ